MSIKTWWANTQFERWRTSNPPETPCPRWAIAPVCIFLFFACMIPPHAEDCVCKDCAPELWPKKRKRK